MISETDLFRKAVAEDVKNVHTITVESMITSPMMAVGITWPLNEADDIMKAQGVRNLLGSELARVVGLLSLRDMLVYLYRKIMHRHAPISLGHLSIFWIDGTT